MKWKNKFEFPIQSSVTFLYCLSVMVSDYLQYLPWTDVPVSMHPCVSKTFSWGSLNVYGTCTLDRTSHAVEKWVHEMRRVGVSTSLPKVDIVLILVDKPIYIPEPGTASVLDREHLNSGLTITSPASSPLILIFRKADWEKVLIHELIHAYDIVPLSPEHLDRWLESKYYIVSRGKQIRATEAYTEALALYYIDPTTFRARKAEHYQRLKKILAFYTGKPWIENTHAFSYHVLKCVILYHFDRFYQALEAPMAHDKLPLYYDMLDSHLTPTLRQLTKA